MQHRSEAAGCSGRCFAAQKAYVQELVRSAANGRILKVIRKVIRQKSASEPGGYVAH
jgi:hypothetical protein